MRFRTVKIAESKTLADIHKESFKDFFLTSLGAHFLDTYYKSCIKSNESVAICAIDENEKMVGFSVGCLHSKGFHKRLIKQNLGTFMLQGIIILFSKPKAIIRLVNNLGKNTDKNDNGNYAELLSIGVLPAYNGQGIGKELIKRFEDEAMNKGCSEMALTTDFDKNSKVLEFYKSTGYEIYYEFITYPERKMYKLKKNLK
ncbi:MAG TPA: GNAT family N-acetyltransferase [Lutibacter sp.]|nr:GNAT family N-acetyltransferase [Lutibacter sp.]